jgi:hypothetical protein
MIEYEHEVDPRLVQFDSLQVGDTFREEHEGDVFMRCEINSASFAAENPEGDPVVGVALDHGALFDRSAFPDWVIPVHLTVRVLEGTQ